MGTNTGIGIGIGIPFKNNALGGDRPYLPPELKARLIGVWDNYGKKNTDADRNIIKNKIPNAGGDLEILNSAYRLNSGFGGYSNDFQEYTYHENVVIKTDTNAVFNAGGQLLIPYPSLTKDVPSFKIKVSGLSNTYHFRYYYRDNNGVQHSVNMAKDGNYELPICYNVQNSSDGTDCGFANNGSDIITVEILPAFEGAFVTDGIDDLITSTKTVQEMLRGSSEYTVLSMIHHIDVPEGNIHSNTVRIKLGSWGTSNRITSFSNNKTGIYGYTVKNQNITVINNILGDKNDYGIRGGDYTSNLEAKFSVIGWIGEDDILRETASIAWYWTIIANKVLTTDEINQVIAYFNLDRTLKPDILCNTIKQGITNENHAEFGDKLIDFSGNGRDIQLNNIAWKGDSGIGKYAADFTSWTTPKEVQKTSDTVKITTEYTECWVAYLGPNNTFKSMKVLISGIPDGGALQFFRTTADGGGIKMVNGINEIPEFTNTVPAGFYIDVPLGFDWSNLVIEQIPSHAGALCLDGVNDFGKVTGMPIYKDYTVIADYIRTFAKENVQDAPILSKSKEGGDGAFIFNYVDYSTSKTLAYSFANINNVSYINDFERNIYYQSKYTNNGNSINAGTGVDTNSMWLGTYRDNVQNYFTGAIYSLMTFPYSMSEFLIERQLKKYKLGTLYPNMVEFRPIVKSNNKWDIIEIWQGDKSLYRPAVNDDKTGIYLKKDSTIGIYVKPYVGQKVSEIVYNGVSYTDLKLNSNGFYYKVVPITKSPQKSDIAFIA